MSLKPNKKIVFWAKVVVFSGLLAYIAHVVRQQPFNWELVKTQFRTVGHPEQWVLGLLFLTPINWGFEAIKWQILLHRVEKTSFWQAYQGVLTGVSLGFALPAQLGDTAGRVLSVRTHRAEAIGASLVSGGMQFYVALVFGTLAWAQHLEIVPERNTPSGKSLLIGLSILSFGGVGFGLVRRRLVQWLSSRRSLARFATYWKVAGLYTNAEIGLALGMASLRYVIFSMQFYCALQLVGIVLPIPVAASGIGLVFLVKTVTPAFNLLSDLGVREAAALWVFSPFGQASGVVTAPVLLTATLALWLVNILTPVLVGLIWVWKLKISRYGNQ
ncbi:lysylphosphatidylglycerol synthase domain-containing protein [Spirosoma litoris]